MRICTLCYGARTFVCCVMLVDQGQQQQQDADCTQSAAKEVFGLSSACACIFADSNAKHQVLSTDHGNSAQDARNARCCRCDCCRRDAGEALRHRRGDCSRGIRKAGGARLRNIGHQLRRLLCHAV